jgi:phosphoribosylamine--glycine ligase
MNILILGGGGREHALAWAFAQNPKVDRLWCAPGNAGIAEEATCVALDILDGDKLVGFCAENAIDFVVIGPEAPLAEGVADVLRAAGIPTLGPSRAAARLEASKAFAKEICAACGAPTAAGQTFTDPAAAHAWVDAQGAPIVVKADGLAAGKGVTVADTVAQAHAALATIFAEGPGARVVIEEFMPGEEASLFVLTDGTHCLFLGTAQDHKRAFDGDRGPNTGGMGAYSPAPLMTPEVTEAALDRIVRPTLAEMARRGTPYQGVLYAGLMVADGEPRLVEYNVRFGDPEAQVLAMRLGAQLLDACLAAATGTLAGARVNFADDAAMTVVMAADGYPGDVTRGEPIALAETDDPRVKVFHAGTRLADGRLVSNGGRVLNATARAPTLAEARTLAYAALDAIDWPGGFARRDIGWRALAGTMSGRVEPPDRQESRQS